MPTKKKVAKKKARTVCVVKARCMVCKTPRTVREDETPKGHHPLCQRCFGPLVAISATRVPA